MLLFKLIATPFLLVVATIAIRRWGEAVGGFLVGLPLTSGPISVFLALENGPRFAMQASSGSLTATAAQAGFCMAYCQLAAHGWLVALTGACIAFVLSASVLQWAALPAGGLFVIALLAMTIALYRMPRDLARSAVFVAPRWDLPARMVLMAGLVVGVTLIAPYVGAQVSGVLASFPFMAIILAVFAHRSVGPNAAKRVMRGMVAGLFGFAVFFYVLSLTLTRLHLGAAYGCAVAGTLAVQAIALQRLRRPMRPDSLL